MGSSWGGTLEAALEGSLGRESQSDERVMSLPKHAVKLPYWSSLWYRQFCRDLAYHIYALYIHSPMTRLPPLIQPHFGSEAEPNVLFFLSLPCNPARRP